jgi:hypothetical protein
LINILIATVNPNQGQSFISNVARETHGKRQLETDRLEVDFITSVQDTTECIVSWGYSADCVLAL